MPKGNSPKTSTKKMRNVVAGKVSSASSAVRSVTHEEVARRAYQLWEADGRQDGRHEQHWVRAEHDLLG